MKRFCNSCSSFTPGKNECIAAANVVDHKAHILATTFADSAACQHWTPLVKCVRLPLDDNSLSNIPVEAIFPELGVRRRIHAMDGIGFSPSLIIQTSEWKGDSDISEITGTDDKDWSSEWITRVIADLMDDYWMAGGEIVFEHSDPLEVKASKLLGFHFSVIAP